LRGEDDALLAAIPSEESGIASGIANALRNVAATLGVTCFGALVAGGLSSGAPRVFVVSAATLALALALTLAWIRPRARHGVPVAVIASAQGSVRSVMTPEAASVASARSYSGISAAPTPTASQAARAVE
jgi:hypothetical protein